MELKKEEPALGTEVGGLWNIPRSGEEKGVVELKHDIMRLQKKKQEELDRLLLEVTAQVKKEFEDTFVKKYSGDQKESAAGYMKMLDQLNFWRKKRQTAEKDREYADTPVVKEELEVELKFIDKRIEAYSKRCERYKGKCQKELDSLVNFREKELKEFYASIKDFLLSREAAEEGEEMDAEIDAEEDELELRALAKSSLK